MRATLSYTVLRLAVFVVAGVLLYVAGARGILLIGLAAVVSAVVSLVLLARQREAMAGSISSRMNNARRRLADVGHRLDEGAKVEDVD
jgi:hypothetical protein